MKKIEVDFSHSVRVGKVKVPMSKIGGLAVGDQILFEQDEISPEFTATEFDDCCAHFDLGWTPARLVTMGYSVTRKHQLGLND